MEDPKLKLAVTYRRLTTTGIGHSWRTQVITTDKGQLSLPDHVIRRVVKQLAGQFPSNSWLYTIGKQGNPNCDICTTQLPATVGHIQCDCSTLAEARTKAHNMIWDIAWDTLLKQASKQGWEGHKEKPLGAMGWLEDDTIARLQPDGILHKDTEQGTRVILVDLTRCRGYDTEVFQMSAQRKELKYGGAVQLLEQSEQICSARILALPIGHTGNISEQHWEELTTALDYKDKAKAKLYKATTAAGIQAFSFMITMWKEARRAHLTRTGASPLTDTTYQVDRT